VKAETPRPGAQDAGASARRCSSRGRGCRRRSPVAAGRRHRATGWPGPARRGRLRRPRPVEPKPACAERLG
jgi:hypothetical protein